MDQTIQYQSFDFALAATQLFSANRTIFLSNIGPLTSGGLLSDNDGVIHVGETVTLDGRSLTMLGSGTATPGIDLLGAVVPLGTAVDVIILSDPSTGRLFFAWPEGPPNLLSSVAVVLSLDAVGYDTTVDAPLCFVAGARIATPDGPRAVESLQRGDIVLTWAGDPARVLASVTSDIAAPDPRHRPIVIDTGAFGPDLPARRLKLSPQHRLCLPDSDPEGPEPLLGPAAAFAILPRVHRCNSAKPVHYVHLVLDRHCLICAEGLPAESFHIADRTLSRLPAADRAIILSELPPARMTPAGHFLTRGQAKALIEAWQVRKQIGLERAAPARWTAAARQTDSKLWAV